MKNEDVKVGDIICYHNLRQDELYFHMVLEIKKDGRLDVTCLNKQFSTNRALFDYTLEYTRIKNPNLVRLVLL